MDPSEVPLEDRDRPYVQPPRREIRPERLTLVLLLLALSTLFLSSVDKGYFYRPGTHDYNSLKNLLVSENLSPDSNFRLFEYPRPVAGDASTYDMYSFFGRFPVGGYVLIKLAILPFGNDLSGRIVAARMLMWLLFSAAALLAFHALARITSHRWIALAATLMAFSSYYMLYYGDAVCVEYSVDLFAVMLVFHGMVVFVQEGRFRQLLARTGVALLLGWHVYAFLLPFIVLGLAHEAMEAWKGGTAVWPRVRSAAAAVLHSRYMALGAAAILFGAAVLGFNFANEYAVFGGERPVAKLPSIWSMLRRTGLQDLGAPFDHLWWLWFLGQQFFRVCVASVPFVLTHWGVDLLGWFPSVGFSGQETPVYVLALLAFVGAAAALVRLAAPLQAWRQRLLLAVLALSGFFWALPMRHNAAEHNHEAMFYVGVPLVFYSLLLLYVQERWGRGPVVALAAAALLAFVASTFRMDQRWSPDARTAEIQRAAAAEFGAIRETTRGKVVLILDSLEPEWSGHVLRQYYRLRPRGWRYYLAGSVLARSSDVEVAARAADFIVSYDRVESDALLTPGNERVFLYDSAGIGDLVESYRAAYRQAVYGEPVARSYFDVYLGNDVLAYVREPCVREDARYRVFVEAIPENLEDLSVWRRWYGFYSVFRLDKHPVLFDGKCIAVLPLPDYPVSGIRTGQAPSRPRGWEVEIPASW